MPLEEAGQAAHPDPQAALGQPGAQLAQEQPGLRLVDLTDQVGLCLDGMGALVAPHRLGAGAALPHEGFVPTHRAGWADLEAPRRLPARGSALDRGDNPLAQIGR